MSASIEDSVLGRGRDVARDREVRLLAEYTVEDGTRNPSIGFVHAWALGQTEAWDDTPLCIGATDTLYQAPLVIKLFDEAQNLARAQAKLVGTGRLEGGRDNHEPRERLWCDASC
jgi:hypothetical protein